MYLSQCHMFVYVVSFNSHCVQSFSCVPVFTAPQTVACQALCPWSFPGKNTSVGCHFLLQGIFLTQGSNPHFLCLLCLQADSLPLVPPEEKWSEVKSLSHVQLFVTPWTVAYQALPSMGFSSQEYWSGLPVLPGKPLNSHYSPTKEVILLSQLSQAC